MSSCGSSERRQSTVFAKSRQARPPKNCDRARIGSLDIRGAPILMVMTMITSTTPPAPWTAAGFRRGFIAALPFIASNGLAGMVMGIAYRGLGLDLTSAVLFSLLIYSATAQAVTLGLWATPLPIAAMVIACIAVNARYLVMGAHLKQLFPEISTRRM